MKINLNYFHIMLMILIRILVFLGALRSGFERALRSGFIPLN